MSDSVNRFTLDQLKVELARINGAADDFERLGADKLADRWAVRRVFVAVSRQYHPDLHGQEAKAFQLLTEEIFMLLSEAERRLRRAAPPGVSRRSRRAPLTRTKTALPKTGKKAKSRRDPVKPSVKRTVAAAVPPGNSGDSVQTESPEPAKNPVLHAKPATPPGLSEQYEAALQAMLASRYEDATNMFIGLIAIAPEDLRYQTALELARGHLARSAGRPQEALEFFHRVCVLDGSCADAIQAIQALTIQGTDDEERLLDRLLGDGR